VGRQGIQKLAFPAKTLEKGLLRLRLQVAWGFQTLERNVRFEADMPASANDTESALPNDALQAIFHAILVIDRRANEPEDV
jgi:hypothetical protein